MTKVSAEFRVLWKSHPLHTPGMFLPHDAEAICHHGSSARINDEWTVFADLANKALGRLLSLNYPMFLSHVLFNLDLRAFLESSIQYGYRHYHHHNVLVGGVQEPKYSLLMRRIFMVYHRASQTIEFKSYCGSIFPDSSSVLLNDDHTTMKLLGDELALSGFFTAAVALDLASSFITPMQQISGVWSQEIGMSHANLSLLSKMLHDVGQLQGSTYWQSFEEAGKTIAKVLSEIRGNLSLSSLAEEAVLDLCDYVMDITVSLESLLKCDAAFARMMEPGIASGLQEFCQQSLSIEMVLLFDQTIPSLEEAVLGSQSISSISDTEKGRTDGLAAKSSLQIARRAIMAVLHTNIQSAFFSGPGELLPGDSVADSLLKYLMCLLAVQGTSHTSEKLLAAYATKFSLDITLYGLVAKGVLDEARVEYLLQSIEVINAGYVEEQQQQQNQGQGSRSLLGLGGGKQPLSKQKATTSKRDLTEQKIKKVKKIFNYGEGFIEACLHFFNGDLESVVSALAEQSLPPQLERLDKNMQKIWLGKKEISLDDKEDREFQDIQRKRMAEYERNLEEKEYIVSMYDDDFDDQWEEMQGLKVEVGGASLMTDLESIKKYNRFKRDEEDEDAFWANMANKNRVGTQMSNKNSGESESNNHDGDDDEREAGENKQPSRTSTGKNSDDNIRRDREGKAVSSRTSKAQGSSDRIGGKGKGKNTNESAEMSKLQKRRKDQNKAKVANHNRKSGASKKMARGML